MRGRAFVAAKQKGPPVNFGCLSQNFLLSYRTLKYFRIYIIVRKFVCLGYKKVCMVYEFSVIVEIFEKEIFN